MLSCVKLGRMIVLFCANECEIQPILSPDLMELQEDDTVHFLVRFRRKLDTDHSMATAVAETINEVGRPITITSIILSISFLILLLGSFTPNIHFGGVTSIVVSLALIADLLVLPSAMYLIKPKF